MLYLSYIQGLESTLRVIRLEATTRPRQTTKTARPICYLFNKDMSSDIANVATTAMPSPPSSPTTDYVVVEIRYQKFGKREEPVYIHTLPANGITFDDTEGVPWR